MTVVSGLEFFARSMTGLVCDIAAVTIGILVFVPETGF